MLNLKNTLDGYLKNVEVIGNTIQDTNNLADIRSVGDKVEGQELYKIGVVSCGKNLFKMCKDNEIHRSSYNGIIEIQHNGFSLTDTRNGDMAGFVMKCKPNTEYVVTFNDVSSTKVQKFFRAYTEYPIDSNANYNINVGTTNGSSIKLTTTSNCNYIFFGVYGSNGTSTIKDIQIEEGTQATPYEPYQEQELEILSPVQLEKVGDVADRIVCKDGVWGVDKKVDAEVKNNVLVNTRTNSEFIPLPHDQQVKLRTFAGQTNIAFLTEIPGQVKAQVPKSLGATVNTHTEQIAELHNSLDRVKKLEETTISTIETGSSFTTVDATSNGYFEDVKLEGKTLVNLWDKDIIDLSTSAHNSPNYSHNLKANTVYTFIFNATVANYDIVYLYAYTSNNVLKYYNLTATTSGLNIKTFIPSEDVRISYIGRSSTIEGLIYSNCMLLEGDHTNNLPEFFEGLMSVGQDVEEVSVISNTNILAPGLEYVDLGTSHSYRCNSSLKSLTTATITNTSNDIIQLGLFNRTTEQHYMNINIQPNTTIELNSYLVDNFIKWISFIKGYWENKSDTTQYYKHLVVNGDVDKKPLLYFNPTTETWEKPVLREWDTIEKHSDGKYYYHKRSGEVVLNGSENWSFIANLEKDDTLFYHLSKTIGKNGAEVICDKFIYKSQADVVDYECFRYHNGFQIRINKSRLSTQDVAGFKAWLKANPTTVVYQLAQEEIYECTNIDLMTYSGETNYIINSGAISPKSTLKVHNNISNVVKILQEKVLLLENTFIAGLRSVLSGDMYSLATILYPEDFEQNDNTEQDIMVIPE